MDLFTKPKHTHIYRKQTYHNQRGKAGWRDILGLGINIYIPLYIKQIINRDLLYNIGNFSIFYSNLHKKRTDICMCCAMLSSSVMSDSLQSHGPQPARLLCSQGFSRQEYQSGLSCSPPGDLPNLGFEPVSPTLQAESLSPELSGKSKNTGMGTLLSSWGSSRPRNQTRGSFITGGFFTS